MMISRRFAKRSQCIYPFQKCLSRREDDHTDIFSMAHKSNTSHQKQFSSHIVESPFPKVDIPQILIPEMMFDIVDKYPDVTALRCGLTGRSYKFAELQKLSRRFMNSLIKAGFSSKDVIAIVMQNCPEYAIATLGVLEAGMIGTFINHVYTIDEILHQLKDSGSICVVSGVETLAVVRAAITKLEQTTNSNPIKKIIAVDIPSPDSLPDGVMRFSEMIADHVDHSSKSIKKIKPSDLAFMPYSSGTTGLAKGVYLSHNNIVSAVYQGMAAGIDFRGPDKEQDTILGLLPFFHIYGLVMILLSGLISGSQTITFPQFQPKLVIHTLEKEKVSVLPLVPTLIAFLGMHPAIVSEKHLANARYLISGAEPVHILDMERLKEKLPPECILTQAYGMTELLLATFPTSPIKNFRTCGAPVSLTQAKIVCSETGNNLGPNQSGQLCFRGPQVMLGYHNNPRASADMIDGEGWLQTGDFGYYDEDNHFYIQGRLKELIKVKGFQVAPAELEKVLISLPEIMDAGVIGVPDSQSGEVPVAYVVKAKESTLTEDKVKKFLSKHVAGHKQVSKVFFVEKIPKSASGKILRKDLQEWFEDGKK